MQSQFDRWLNNLILQNFQQYFSYFEQIVNNGEMK